MRDTALQKTVLNDLGDDGLHQLADELGTSDREAKKLVRETLASLTGTLAEDAKSQQGAKQLTEALNEAPTPTAGSVGPSTGGTPLKGVMAFAGGSALSGGIMGSVLGKVTMPVAKAVSARTGLPVAQVSKAMRILLPIAMTAISQLAKKKKVRASGLHDMLEHEQKAAQSPGGLLGTVGNLLRSFGKATPA